MDIHTLAITAVGVVILYVVVSHIVATIRARQFQKENGCQAPPKFPQFEKIVGLECFKSIAKAVIDHKSLEVKCQRGAELGDTYSTVSMGQFSIVTQDPENVKAVLATNFKDFGIGERLRAFGPLLGRGIFTADGVHWEHSRALIRPSFSKAQIADLEMLENHVQNFLARIPRDGSTVDLQPLFFNLTMDSSTESLFGESILCQPSYEGSDAQKFADAFNYAQAELQLRHTLGRLSMFRRNAKFNEACKTIHNFADKYVKLGLEHRRQVQMYGEKESSGSKERYVFLNSLSESTSDPVQLRNELLNILLAGRDTTAGLLSNCFHALARHPEVWKKLKEEVDSLEGRVPDYETLKNMTYLKWVLNEALRLWPSVPINARFANRDTVLPRGGGPNGQFPVFVPKGGSVVYSVYAMQRRRDVFGPDANEFRPERWAPDAPGGALRPGWAYLPFNGGPRICVGQQFALTNAGYTMVRILQTFSELESRDPSPWVEHLGVTLSSHYGTKVSLKPR